MYLLVCVHALRVLAGFRVCVCVCVRVRVCVCACVCVRVCIHSRKEPCASRLLPQTIPRDHHSSYRIVNSLPTHTPLHTPQFYICKILFALRILHLLQKKLEDSRICIFPCPFVYVHTFSFAEFLAAFLQLAIDHPPAPFDAGGLRLRIF